MHYSISKKAVFLMGSTKTIDQHITWIENNTKWSPKFFGIKTKTYSVGVAISK